MARTPLRFLIAALLSSLLGGPSPGLAQDDIFADPGGELPLDFAMPQLDQVAAENGASGEAGPVAEDDPFLTQLRVLAGGTPRQVGVALREAIRQRLWSEVQLYTSTAHYRGFDEAARRQVAREVGSRYLGRGIDASELAEASRQELAALRELLLAAARDRQQLSDAVAALGSEEPDRRAAAARTLLRGGRAAMELLLAAAVEPEPPAPLADLIRLLREFGEPARRAAAQLARFGSTATRPAGLKVLYGLDPEAASVSFAAILHAPGASAEERRIAAAGWRRLNGEPPTEADAATLLAERLRLAEQQYVAISAAAPQETLWRVDEQGEAVAARVTSAATARAAATADLAELLRRQGALRPQHLLPAFAATLRYRFLADPAFGSEADLQQLRRLWGDVAGDVGLLGSIVERYSGASLRAADQPLDEAAVIGAIRLLGGLGDSAALIDGGGEVAPLVRAVDHPAPRVRYEAASAIGRLEDKQPYAGSGRVLERWIEMSGLGAAPRALMLENDPALASKLGEQLAELGFRVVTVSSVDALVREVDAGGDLQWIVATTLPPDDTLPGLIDRVRRRPLGSNVPLALVGPAPRLGVIGMLGERWRAPVELIPVPRDSFEPGDAGDPRMLAERAADTLRARLISLRRAGILPPLSPADRRLFALDGETQLATLAEDRALEEVYAWREREPELVAAFQREGYDSGALKVLSALGSGTSQALLATLVAAPGLDETLRSEAAAAFDASIARFGTRMRRSEVELQYDRFNASPDPQTRALIGRVLDAMEARVGVTSK